VSARASILGRLRQAERTGHVPAGQPPVHSPDRGPDGPLIDRFVRELAALGVNSFVELSEADARARVASIVGTRSVLRWDARQLPYGVGEMFPSASTGASARQEQAAAEVGITGVDAAIAETGSLALLSGEGKPRAASLLPPTHVAIVRRGDLRGSLGEFFSSFADAIAGAACCTFVTGPSRTADIELTLTLGVHGPGVVIVVVGP
jgi:L-lactate dehydrogenase complex protein LldG